MQVQPHTKKQAVDTGILFALLAIIAGLFTHKSHFYFIAAGLLLMLLVYPGIFRLPALLWFEFARLLSNIMSRVLLTLIFYLLIMPVGLFRRLGGYDRLRLRKFKQTDSPMWENRNHIYQPDDLTHIF